MNRAVRVVKTLGLYFAVATAGFVGGILLFYVHSVRSGPTLQLWHTETLTAEFAASMADKVRSFEQYLRLEETLFAELDERIYQRTETGSELDLTRYSTGSAADPRQRNPDWNHSFEMPAADPARGVLLLHGMTDSPYSLRSLAALALNYVLDNCDNELAVAPASLVLISPSVAVARAAALAAWKERLAHIPGLEKLAWIHLGQIDFQGERDLLKFPADCLLRLRYNPFYRLLEERALQWIDRHSTAPVAAGS